MHKNTKNTARVRCLILIFAILCASALSITAFADEPQTISDTAESGVPNERENDVSDAAADNTGEAADEGFFDSLLSAFEDNLSQILSALAFVGSLIVMLCYKRGLLPLINDGLSALAAGVKSIGEKANELNIDAAATTEQINGRLEDAQKLLLSMETAMTALNARLDTLDGEKNEQKRFRTVLAAEVDMLYEIFTSAALPQYLKDSVGERIAKMKYELSEQTCDDEN